MEQRCLSREQYLIESMERLLQELPPEECRSDNLKRAVWAAQQALNEYPEAEPELSHGGRL